MSFGVILFYVEMSYRLLFEDDYHNNESIDIKNYIGFAIIVSALLAYMIIGDYDLIGKLCSKKKRTNSKADVENSVKLEKMEKK
jgi:hypothetical protein